MLRKVMALLFLPLAMLGGCNKSREAKKVDSAAEKAFGPATSDQLQHNRVHLTE